MPHLDPSPAPVHVVQLTDAHLFANPAGTLLGLNTRDSLRHVVAQVRREQPHVDLLLCTGDLSQDGSVASYEAFRALTGGIAVPTRWLPGNHDEAKVMAQVAPELVQSVTDIAGWRVVMLDTAVPGATHGLLGQDQLSILDEALASAGERHCLVCCHHQPVDIGCAWIAPIGLRNADQLLRRLKGYPQVKVLLWGTFTRSGMNSAMACACWPRRRPASSSRRAARTSRSAKNSLAIAGCACMPMGGWRRGRTGR